MTPARRCLLYGPSCSNNGVAVTGGSRCTYHKGKRSGPRLHDGEHNRLAKQVVARAQVCALCGFPPTADDPLEAGHIIALSQGGQSILANYRAEHRSHNRSEGAKLARRGSPDA